MLLSVKGVFADGHVELLEQVSDVPEGEVLVVFFVPDVAPTQGTELVKDEEEHESKSWFGRVRDTASSVGTTVGSAAIGSGHFVVGTASGAYEAAGRLAYQAVGRATDAGTEAAQHAYPLLSGLTSHAGSAVEFVAANPTLRRLAQNFNLERWLDVSEHVDIEKAQESVANLKKEYPDETSAEIAHRLITQKALYAGGIGLSTGLLPGSALPLLAVDIAATALLQAELVYQIAAAYNLDLEDPARKGELLVIFGCVLGASRAVKAGLAVLKNAPVAGAVIGASANAVMIYSLGHVACHFYGEKLHLQATAKSLEAVKKEGELSLQAATNQEAVVDQLLVHIFRAGRPDASKEELLDILEAANLSSSSFDSIMASLDEPQPLDELLSQLQPEFMIYLQGQCRRIAHMDGVLTDEEKEVLDKIASHLEQKHVV